MTHGMTAFTQNLDRTMSPFWSVSSRKSLIS